MKHYTLITVLIFLSGLVSCGKGDPLTQQKLDAYIASYNSLREQLPEMLKQANAGNKQAGGEFDGILKKNGLSSQEFAMINAKVGAIFSTLNSDMFMDEMQKMKDDGMVQMDDGMKQLQDQLDNPDVPEASKAEIRKSLEELKAAKGQINDEFKKNKKFADKVLTKTKSVTNQFISPEDVELIRKNFDKIQNAFTGGIVPSNFNVKDSN